MSASMSEKSVSARLLEGVRNGAPIGAGYFAVAFSLGIAARNAGFSPFQAFLSSILCSASAGQYTAYTLIAAAAPYLEVAIMTLIANARYLLMSCAMSQKLDPKTGLVHRLAMSFALTDELFAINITRPGYLDPVYWYGAMLVSVPLWAAGCAIGTVAGNIMPARAVSALSVALYGMFLAVVIPPAKKSRVIAGLIFLSAALSCAFSWIPAFTRIPAGTRTILLTLAVSAAAAALFPVPEQKEGRS